MADGDKLKYDSYKGTDVIEFWGLVWEYEQRVASKNITKVKGNPLNDG